MKSVEIGAGVCILHDYVEGSIAFVVDRVHVSVAVNQKPEGCNFQMIPLVYRLLFPSNMSNPDIPGNKNEDSCRGNGETCTSLTLLF